MNLCFPPTNLSSPSLLIPVTGNSTSPLAQTRNSMIPNDSKITRDFSLFLIPFIQSIQISYWPCLQKYAEFNTALLPLGLNDQHLLTGLWQEPPNSSHCFHHSLFSSQSNSGHDFPWLNFQRFSISLRVKLKPSKWFSMPCNIWSPIAIASFTSALTCFLLSPHGLWLFLRYVEHSFTCLRTSALVVPSVWNTFFQRMSWFSVPQFFQVSA